MSGAIALLPMYDWPEIRTETDCLWAKIRDVARARGLDAPKELSRPVDLMKAWLSPDLFLAQTCGFPYASRLADRVSVVGTPTYRLPDCPPGRYRSVIIRRRGAKATCLEDLADAVCAYNQTCSQSGFRVLDTAFRDKGIDTNPLERGIETGSHRASIRAVAAGQADYAAIDAVSWVLACRHEPAALETCAIVQTKPTPGLPIIASAGRETTPLAEIISEAIAGLDEQSADALCLAGFVRTRRQDYDCYCEQRT